jgi:hypothetical protein
MSADAPATTGYLHPDYAASLAEFGRPRLLPRSGGWILERSVGEGPNGQGPHRDAMGCYPLFACRDWSSLDLDLAEIGRDLVSLSLVADPFADVSPETLASCFPDRMIRFKDHFIADLDAASPATVSKHHRYYARRALAAVDVAACTGEAEDLLDEWTGLYSTLAARHGLTGMKAFSPASFAIQLRIPGLVALVAREEGRIVGAHLWYVQGDVAYSHLAAVNERGYALSVAYALYSFALDHFRGKARWLNFGAGAGAGSSADDGLSRFKRGWATETRPAWFCGRIFDPELYAALAQGQVKVAGDYFPAYRAGEFG